MKGAANPGGYAVGTSRCIGAKMVKIMNMATGNSLDEFGAFAEEVLNAGGLPQALLEQLGLQEALPGRGSRQTTHVNPEEFLEQIYRLQE